jgi:hypothetical protein
MKSLLSIIRSAAPAKAEAKPAARADFDRRLAAFRKANGIVDRCQIGFVCSRTGGRFECEFERGAPGELFALVSTRKQGGGFAAGRGARDERRAFNVDELDLSRWACPCCNATSWVHCQCGTNGCDPRPDHNTSVSLYKCPGCGLASRTVPLTRIETRQGGGIPSHSGAAQLSQSRNKLLPRK